MPKNLFIAREHGHNTTTGSETIYPYPDTVYRVALTANTVTTLTIPGDIPNQLLMAKFSHSVGTDLWILYNSTATLTIPTTADSQPSVLNPGNYVVQTGRSLQLLTSFTGVVVDILFYVPFTAQP